ncbi:MurR/RpiR family transcriptional regulator [Ollibium composti]|uniref:MurR/RpiR family transcriptional regulator n=1 Tax=Ollibium composti TaxID=2675109 RepID=A0ABY2Q8G8_9HYPH|nr:MurR/RpiR family transcriptional regulator [Mesorhizobium composti]THF58158.1 MurR/RpiR family transcriptional regulator [Mesorhizobium composti]
MPAHETFDQRITARMEKMSAAEQRVARVFQESKEEVLMTSAAALAAKAGTSDATVVRTTRTLGFSGMEELRRSLAAEMKENLSPATRVAATLQQVGDGIGAALEATLNIHQECIERLRRDLSAKLFENAVGLIADAGRTVVFGIGPSSAMATYLEIQLRRFGLEASSLTRTGILFADDLQTLRPRDLVIVLAYGRVYREVDVLLREARRAKLKAVLITDTLAAPLRDRVELVLPVARGRADMFSTHTATLALIEALLVGVAAKLPDETLESLGRLDALRHELAAGPANLPTLRRP